jgi:hypothetical protein
VISNLAVLVDKAHDRIRAAIPDTKSEAIDEAKHRPDVHGLVLRPIL